MGVKRAQGQISNVTKRSQLRVIIIKILCAMYTMCKI